MKNKNKNKKPHSPNDGHLGCFQFGAITKKSCCKNLGINLI